MPHLSSHKETDKIFKVVVQVEILVSKMQFNNQPNNNGTIKRQKAKKRDKSIHLVDALLRMSR